MESAREIAACVRRHYGDRGKALGIYGSLARGLDGPYSDIEMHCVLLGTGIDECIEWSAGPWKAEVNVYTENVILAWASEVDVDWPLTHGAYTEVLNLYDPADFFPHLRATTLSQPDQVFDRVILDVIVGELYERIGKARNARAAKHDACMPYLAVDLVKMGACLIGLASRHLYTTATRAFEESLELPDRPGGYDTLCRMAMVGDLSDAARIADAADAFWSGIETWASKRGIALEQELAVLLRSRSINEGG